MRRAQVSLVALACGLGLLAASAVPSRLGRGQERRNLQHQPDPWGLDSLDPALSYTAPGWALLSATCAGLMRYPSKPPPAGLRIAPDVAAFPPRVSSDGKTYTFTLRKNFRFSDGKPVQADAFARAISRMLIPGMKSPGAEYAKDIVGAEAVTAGTRTVPAGVTAGGTRLVIKFTRPIPDFPLRTTMPFFCAVPPGLPADPEGRAVFAAAGPYVVSEFIRGRRAVLRRNPFYRGGRLHVDRFIVDMQAASPARCSTRSNATRPTGDGCPRPSTDPARGLARKYGGSRYFLAPGWALRGYLLNSHRPLFKNNPRLRRAVNFAVDREALLRGWPGQAADQLVPPGIPGFRDAAIYPLERPNVREKPSLVGHLRGERSFSTRSTPKRRVRAQVLGQSREDRAQGRHQDVPAPGVLRSDRKSQGRLRHRGLRLAPRLHRSLPVHEPVLRRSPSRRSQPLALRLSPLQQADAARSAPQRASSLPGLCRSISGSPATPRRS